MVAKADQGSIDSNDSESKERLRIAIRSITRGGGVLDYRYVAPFNSMS